MSRLNALGFCKNLLIGRARSLTEDNLFHKVSLVALFAWVGLGADGLSSSCYGPEETFKAIGSHHYLALLVGLAAVLTIVAICASYSQIIGLFPSGGGGYLVASKLLSPAAGVVSGSALLIDYVLTITISVASGADALFSLFPPEWQQWKLGFALGGVAGLTLLNLRGVRESVVLWVPVFFVFIGTHAFGILYALVTHARALSTVPAATVADLHSVSSDLGWFGLLALLLKAYSMGAGTYTGIEAVSNGLPMLREPRVATGRRAMIYMGASLALTVLGLLVAYLLFAVAPVEGKTLNAVLFEHLAAAWPSRIGSAFVWIALASEAALLLIAAQTGFLDGPRVAASMALDRWLPSSFANLSDRFVTQNGLLFMGGMALLMMLVTRGSVALLVVFYSINVFITFSLSQLGMVVHWWRERRTQPAWRRKLAINGFGLLLTTFILVSLTLVKFHDGGWLTLVVTAALVALAFTIKRHYSRVADQLRRLDPIVAASDATTASFPPTQGKVDPTARTAVVLVNGYNGLGLHTALQVPRMFGAAFRNCVFVQIGAVDAGSFKGAAELERLREDTALQAGRYVRWARSQGFGATSITSSGHDITGEITSIARRVATEYPASVFFAGQLLFTHETRITRWLHNYTALALQRRFYLANLPFVVLPVRVGELPADGAIAPGAAKEESESPLAFRLVFVVLVVLTIATLFWQVGQRPTGQPRLQVQEQSK